MIRGVKTSAIIRRPRRQIVGRAGVIGADLARGLIGCYNPSPWNGLLNLAGGAPSLTAQSSGGIATSAVGRSLQCLTTNQGAFSTVGATSTLSITGSLTLLWHGVFIGDPIGTNPTIFDITANNNDASPFIAYGIERIGGLPQAMFFSYTTAGPASAQLEWTTAINNAAYGTPVTIVLSATAGGAVKLYVNGVDQGAGTQNAGVAFDGAITYTATSLCCLGCYPAVNTRSPNAYADLAMIWNRALTPGEAAAMFANPYRLLTSSQRSLIRSLPMIIDIGARSEVIGNQQTDIAARAESLKSMAFYGPNTVIVNPFTQDFSTVLGGGAGGIAGSGLLLPMEFTQAVLSDTTGPVETILKLQSDSSPQAEVTNAVLGHSDSTLVIENISAVQSDRGAPAETTAAFRGDSTSLDESLRAVSADVAAPMENLRSQASDTAAAAETIAAQRSDLAAPLESVKAVSEDLAAPAEATRTIRSDSNVQGEAVASFLHDTVASDEIVAARQINIGVQAETEAAVTIDLAAPIEALSVVVFATNSAFLLETIANKSLDLAAAAEASALTRANMAGTTENLQSVVAESAAAVETLHAIAVDAALRGEFIAGAMVNMGASAEIVLSFDSETGGRLEGLLGVRADAGLPIENLLIISIAANSTYTIEFGSSVAADTAAVVEALTGLQSDTAMQLESSVSIVAITTNSGIPIEYTLRIVGARAVGDALIQSLAAGDKLILSTSDDGTITISTSRGDVLL